MSALSTRRPSCKAGSRQTRTLLQDEQVEDTLVTVSGLACRLYDCAE